MLCKIPMIMCNQRDFVMQRTDISNLKLISIVLVTGDDLSLYC
jgi:hypothetical protein